MPAIASAAARPRPSSFSRASLLGARALLALLLVPVASALLTASAMVGSRHIPPRLCGREAGGAATVSLNIRHYLTNILTRIVENPTTNKYFRLNISGERAIHSSIWHDDDYRWLLVAVGFVTSDTKPDTHVKAPVNPRTVQKARTALQILKASAPP